jgi:acyl phosphate:glycerol-3-phosphate acyltransferase
MEFMTLSILSYLVGSISFGIVFSHIFRLQDPRSFGSKNPGATNVMRTGKKLPALLTLIGDASKGSLMVWIAKSSGLSLQDTLIVASLVFLGHIYPIYYKFKGGKGVATAFGVLVILNLNLALMVLVVWLTAFIISRISSLSALLAALSVPVIAYLISVQSPEMRFYLFLSAVLIYRHKDNIKKILSNKESQFK